MAGGRVQYMIPYFWDGEIKFVKFRTTNYREACALAKCCFGEAGVYYLYKKPLEE